jgi:hypothetical protein
MHEKGPTVISSWANENRNNNEITLYINQNGYNQKDTLITSVGVV